MSPTPGSGSRNPHLRELSPQGQAAVGWFRMLSRALKVFRLYRPDNPTVVNIKDHVAESLLGILTVQGGWDLRFSATEIFLADEVIIRATRRSAADDEPPDPIEHLPFQFYKDGVRRIRLNHGVPRAEIDTLIEAMRTANHGVNTHDDLVTLLWQANLSFVQLEAVPLEQTIYLSSRGGGGGGGGERRTGQAYQLAPTGSELRGDIGQVAGPQGLHRDTFDDWALPDEGVDPVAAYAALEPAMDASRMRFVLEWEQERVAEWTDVVPSLYRRLLECDPSPDAPVVYARSVVGWFGNAVGRSAWPEAMTALELLRDIDPALQQSASELRGALAAVDVAPIVERLDEADADEQAEFAGLVVAVGMPALDFACTVLGRAERARARAAVCTALCYLCSDQPGVLEPHLSDLRWPMVRNVVFVLGSIGGAEVVPMLEQVARHPEPRVRRQLISALANVPAEARVSILLSQLDSRDPQVLAAALGLLTRERDPRRDPRIVKAILHHIQSPDFEARDDGNQRVMFNALAEVAGDEAVATLETVLQRGGWFARRTLSRSAAARTLARLGSPAAVQALEAGLRSRNDAIRLACLEAMSAGSRAA